MSTYHVPVLFFGRIFDTEEEASAFLTKHGTDYHSDSMDNEDLLCRHYVAPSDTWALGFLLKPGTSDSYARERWCHLFDDEPGQAWNVVDSY